MTRQELRRVTIEEYIEANGGIDSFLEGLADFAKERGLSWLDPLRAMSFEVQRRQDSIRKVGV